MKHFWILSFLYLLPCLGFAQKVYWANEVVSVSSEYQDDYYSAKQALGVPNGFFDDQLDYMAWTPAKESANTGEHIHVSFKKARSIQQILIYQMGNPGAISKITLIDLQGKKHKVYEEADPKSSGKKTDVFRKSIPKTAYKVKELKLELKTKDVIGANQIDAIGISDSREMVNLKIDQIKIDQSAVGKIEKLSQAINSPYSERMPLISPDGNTLYFARKKHPQNLGTSDKDDIWVSYLGKDKQWSKALNIGSPLNNEKHNFVVAIDPSGKKLYLANDYKGGKKDAISKSIKSGRSWTQPERLKIEDHYNNSKFVNYHLSNDGNTLLMAVERENGFGDRDLYVSFKKGKNDWSKPKNLGSKINTVASENSVFLASDNKTIYFSSNGHMGYGGYDIFVAKRLDGTWQNWSQPKNLGKPINTKYNDLSFSIPASGDYAYFSAGSINNTDLYRVKLPKAAKPEPVTIVTTKFIDAETGKPVEADVFFEELNANKNKKVSQNNGRDSKYVVPAGEDVSFYAEAEGYFPVSDHINNSYDEIEELDQDNDSYSTSQELRKLQAKLERVQGDIQKLNKQRKKTNILLEKQKTKKEENDDGYKEVFKNVNDEKENTENAELAALMNKYNLHYNKDQEKAPKSNKKQKTALSSKSTKPKKPVGTSNKSKDSALAEMKKKYNKHYNKEDKPSEELKEEVVEEETVNEEENVVSEDKPVYTVEEIKKVREELIKELVPQIKMELYDEYYDQIRKDVKKELELELKNDEMQAVEEQVKEQIIDNWEEELEEEVVLTEAEKEDLQTDLWFRMEGQLEDEIKDELAAEIKQELERETRIALKEKQQALIQEKIENEISQAPKQMLKSEKSEIDEVKTFKEVEKDVMLVPLKVGAIIPMNNIFFDANQATLKNASYAELDRIINFLFKNERIVVEIGGHTNGWCSHEFASELSQERAEVVMNYIVENGVRQKRIYSKGYGKTKPLASNDSLQGRKQNQRVELKILEIID